MTHDGRPPSYGKIHLHLFKRNKAEKASRKNEKFNSGKWKNPAELHGFLTGFLVKPNFASYSAKMMMKQIPESKEISKYSLLF
jgi:hypothetical protein